MISVTDKFAIFLDFDDVMIGEVNQNGQVRSTLKETYWGPSDFRFEPSAVTALQSLIDYIGSEQLHPIIVLSTSWVKYATRKVLREVLSKHFPRHIDPELTFSCKPVVMNRRDRIQIWLDEYSEELHTPTSYFIIDDTYSGTGLRDFRSASAVTTLDHRTLLTTYAFGAEQSLLNQSHVDYIKLKIELNLNLDM
jgi:hypothetical protein